MRDATAAVTDITARGRPACMLSARGIASSGDRRVGTTLMALEAANPMLGLAGMVRVLKAAGLPVLALAPPAPRRAAAAAAPPAAAAAATEEDDPATPQSAMKTGQLVAPLLLPHASMAFTTL